MSEQENPTQGQVESPSTGFSGDVEMTEVEAHAGLDAFAASLFGEPQEEQPVVSEEATQSEEIADEELELSDDEADIDTPDEADEGSVEDESELQDDGELEIVSYDDLKGIALEIGGEHYTAAQLKSMLGQMKSAGKSAREADEAQKSLQAREEQLNALEAQLNQRKQTHTQSDQLSRLEVAGKQLNKQIADARKAGDMYEVTVLKDKLDMLSQHYRTTKSQVDAAMQQDELARIEKATASLKERGLEYLLSENEQSAAWLNYVGERVSQDEMSDIATNPSIAEAFEKARKYDAARKKKGTKLKTSGKTLKSGVNKPKTVNPDAKKKQAYNDNPDLYFADLAKDLFK